MIYVILFNASYIYIYIYIYISRGVNENTDSYRLESFPEGDVLTHTAHTCLGEWCSVQWSTWCPCGGEYHSSGVQSDSVRKKDKQALVPPAARWPTSLCASSPGFYSRWERAPGAPLITNSCFVITVEEAFPGRHWSGTGIRTTIYIYI